MWLNATYDMNWDRCQQITHIETFDIAKLHSELADPTQFQLIGVGVDFVFAKNGQSLRNRNPHLASTIRNKANVWNFVAALRVFGGCLEVIHMVSGQYLMGAWRVYGLCLNGVYINFKKLGFLNHI